MYIDPLEILLDHDLVCESAQLHNYIIMFFDYRDLSRHRRRPHSRLNLHNLHNLHSLHNPHNQRSHKHSQWE